MSHIFISYQRNDVWVMRSVVTFLNWHGFETWVDEKLTPGTSNWTISVETAIETASAIIVILTPNAKTSEWVREEINHAKKHNQSIYPLLAGDEAESTFIGLGLNQWIDISINFNVGMNLLVDTLVKDLDIDIKKTTIINPKGQIHWHRTGALFWFAADINKLRVKIMDLSIKKDELVKRMKQVIYHSSQINVPDLTIKELLLAQTKLQETNDEDLNQFERDAIENRLRLAMYDVSRMAEDNEVGFKGGPKWEANGD